MVNFEFEPYEKVVVKSYFKEDFDSFVFDIFSGVDEGDKGIVGYLNWGHGIIFYHQAFPNSELIHKERIDGTLHIELLVFAEMENYVKEIPLAKDGHVKIAVIDVSEHTLFGPFTKWISENLVQ